MRGADAPILPAMLTAANNWRSTAAGAGVDLVQINAVMPDGRTCILTWDPEAIAPDTGDWVIDT